MHQFQDSQGRQWQISLNGWQLKKLKERLDFDARDHESILEAAGDPVLLCNVLFLLCEEQAKTANITDEQFGIAMGGDAIDAATQAYLEESADFFPQRQRPALKKLLATMKDAQEKATAIAEEKLNSEAMTAMVDRAMTEQGQKIDLLLAGQSIGS